MRRPLPLPLLLLALVLATACRTTAVDNAAAGDGDLVRGTGTVVHYQLEGGFYAIRAGDGKVYDPVNLPDAFEQDGLRVRFVAKPRPDVQSIHMVGTIVELTSIEKL